MIIIAHPLDPITGDTCLILGACFLPGWTANQLAKVQMWVNAQWGVVISAIG